MKYFLSGEIFEQFFVFDMPTSIAKSLSIQGRVVGALLLREIITRYGRHNIGMLWLFVEPMLFTLGVSAVWYLAKLHSISNIPIVAFAITGYSSVLIWRNTASRCAKAIEPNLSLMYHRNVKVIDIFLSRIILELLGITTSLFTLTIFFTYIDVMKWPADFFLALQGWILLGWFAFGLGLIVGAISERSETFERIWHIFVYLYFPFSGAAFMVEWLPESARNVLLFLPSVHGVEMLRHGFFGDVVITHEDPAYFAYADMVLTLCGMALVRDCGRRVQPE